MMAAGGQNAAQNAGLELVLTAGRSQTERVQFTSQVGATRAMVGAGPSVDWSIAAPGIDPAHAEIAWDGTQLWMRDNGSRGGTFVGAQRLSGDWRVLAVGEQVRLGQATLAVHPLGGAGEEVDEFEDKATQITAGMSMPKAPSSGRDVDTSESTMIVQAPTESQPYGQPVKQATIPPRVRAGTIPPKVNSGVKPANVMPSSSGGIQTVVSEEAQQEIRNAVNAVMNNPAQVVGPNHPTGYYPPQQQPIGGGVNGSIAQQSSPFGDIPQNSEMSAIFGSIPPPETYAQNNAANAAGQAAASKQSLPLRTWGLLGATIIFGAIAIGLPDPKPRVLPPPPIPAELQAPQPVFRPLVDGPPAGQTGVVLLQRSSDPPVPVVPDGGVRPLPRNAPPPPPQTAQMQRQAADFVAQNRIREAIPLYERLHTDHPDQAVYLQILTLLRHKAQEQPCQPGGPTPCPVTPTQ